MMTFGSCQKNLPSKIFQSLNLARDEDDDIAIRMLYLKIVCPISSTYLEANIHCFVFVTRQKEINCVCVCVKEG